MKYCDVYNPDRWVLMFVTKIFKLIMILLGVSVIANKLIRSYFFNLK